MFPNRFAPLLCSLVLLPACVVGGGEQDWEIDGVEAATVRLSNGEVQLRSEEGRSTAFVYYSGGGIGPNAVHPEVRVANGMLMVDAAAGLFSGGELEVVVPAGVPIDAHVERGELSIDLAAPSHLRGLVGAGELSIAMPAGSYVLDLSADMGEVQVQGVVHDEHADHAIQACVGAGELTVTGF
jgi:hypothetical protein